MTPPLHAAALLWLLPAFAQAQEGAAATPKVYDTGWVGDDAETASGPVALGPIDTEFSGFTEQVVYALEGGRTVLTWLGPDRDAAAQGVLLPVSPETVRADLASIDESALEALDRWTQPWLWEETCGQVLEAPPAEGCGGRDAKAADRSSGSGCSTSSSSGCTSSADDSAGWLNADSGNVGGTGVGGAEFALGEYRAWLIGPESVDELRTWLEDQELAQPPGLDEAAGDWIAAGGAFLALRLDLTADTDGRPSPTPVQVTMTGVVPPLPVGLGSLGGPDVRDLVVHTLHEDLAYVPDLNETGPYDCLLDVTRRESADVAQAMRADWHVASSIRDDVTAAAEIGAVWTIEAWLPTGDCTDCQSWDRLADSVLVSLGHLARSSAITRSRLRLDRRAVTATVDFTSPETDPPVGIKRVVERRWELAGLLPACDGTMEEDGGTCFSAAWWAERAANEQNEREDLRLDGSNCGRGSGATILLFPFLLAAFRRRP